MILALVLLQAAASASGPVEVHLACRGIGERRVMNRGSGVAFGPNGYAGSAFGAMSSRKDFEDQLDVNISGGIAKVRMPRRFLPPAHGGEGGWFDVKDLVIGEDYITGKVAVNFANHPAIRLDRRTGTVSMDGKVGSYSGQCEKIDPTARAF